MYYVRRLEIGDFLSVQERVSSFRLCFDDFNRAVSFKSLEEAKNAVQFLRDVIKYDFDYVIVKICVEPYIVE